MKLVLPFLLLCLAYSYAEPCYNLDSCIRQDKTHCTSPTILSCKDHICQCIDSATGAHCQSQQDCSNNCDGIFFIPICTNGVCHCQAH